MAGVPFSVKGVREVALIKGRLKNVAWRAEKEWLSQIFKASSVPFPSLIAKGFSGHFYHRAREALAPESGKTNGTFWL